MRRRLCNVAVVRRRSKILQISLFFLTDSRRCSLLFAWVGLKLVSMTLRYRSQNNKGNDLLYSSNPLVLAFLALRLGLNIAVNKPWESVRKHATRSFEKLELASLRQGELFTFSR